MYLKEVAGSCALWLAVVCGFQASGAGVIYQFDNGFSGTNPDGPAPWVMETLQDVSPGTVMLTVTNVNVSSSEKITELYLNINPNYNVSALQFSFVGGSAGVTAPLPSLGEDSFKADGDGKYDILFQFGQTPSTSFGPNDYLVYQITGIPTLTSSDFVFMSSPAGGHGPFYSAIHVQGITATSVGDTGSYSGWVSPTTYTPLTVPEPGSLAFMLAAGATTAVCWRRRLSRR